MDFGGTAAAALLGDADAEATGAAESEGTALEIESAAETTADGSEDGAGESTDREPAADAAWSAGCFGPERSTYVISPEPNTSTSAPTR